MSRLEFIHNKKKPRKIKKKVPLDKEVENEYKDYWKKLIEPNGVVDIDEVKKELYDYGVLMHEVSKVYDHITGGRLSKTNYPASVIIDEYQEFINRMYIDKDLILDITTDDDLTPSEKVKEIKEYIEEEV